MISLTQIIVQRGKVFIALWSLLMILVFYGMGKVAVALVSEYAATAKARHGEYLNTQAAKSEQTPGEMTLPPGVSPRKVTVGFFLDRIISLSLPESNWSATVYVWFKWKGDDIDPGETFKIVDGDIEVEGKEKLDESTQGDEHYALYRLYATFTKFFDVSRFPLDDHVLNIAIEDQSKTWDQLEYVPDTANTNISSRVKITGFKFYKTALTVKPHAYKTNFGNTRLGNGRAVYSQLTYAMGYSRPGMGFYCKIFVGMYSAVLIAILGFFFVPTDSNRISLSIGGFFGAVASMLVYTTAIPQVGMITLMDMINSVGLITVFLTAVQSTMALHLYELWKNATLSRWFDRISLAIFSIGYLVINIWVPMVAFTPEGGG